MKRVYFFAERLWSPDVPDVGFCPENSISSSASVPLEKQCLQMVICLFAAPPHDVRKDYAFPGYIIFFWGRDVPPVGAYPQKRYKGVINGQRPSAQRAAEP
jgi:hypothetical protein